MSQSEINIGTIGHVDHGKTTLTQALTGKWADTHSEELKRGITIKLGYAETSFYKCEKCKGAEAFSVSEKCLKCGSKARVLRKVSVVDAPGHETLMATVLAASSIIDGALFVIAANEKCPQPQTVEHLAVLEASGIKNVVVVQNKVDLVSKEQAQSHYNQIKNFLKGSSLENAPVVPVVANYALNLDALIQAVEESIPTPKRDLKSSPLLFVARSFDVNKPGCEVQKLSGGVVGGSILKGEFKVGDEIEVLPGALRVKKEKERYVPIDTKIILLNAGKEKIEKAGPGGLIGLSTLMDPALSKGDSLVGSVVGIKGKMPPVWQELSIEVKPLKRVEGLFTTGFGANEPLVLGVGTNTTVGFIDEKKKNKVKLKLKKPVCACKGDRVAVMRRSRGRWRLYGTGKIL